MAKWWIFHGEQWLYLNDKVVDLPWGPLFRSKWQSEGSLVQNALGSLARMLGENGQVVDLPWRTMAQSKWPSG